MGTGKNHSVSSSCELQWCGQQSCVGCCQQLWDGLGGGRDSLRDQQLLQWTDYNVFITKYCLSTKYRVQLYDNMPWKAPKKSIFYKDKAKHCQPDEIIKILLDNWVAFHYAGSFIAWWSCYTLGLWCQSSYILALPFCAHLAHLQNGTNDHIYLNGSAM